MAAGCTFFRSDSNEGSVHFVHCLEHHGREHRTKHVPIDPTAQPRLRVTVDNAERVFKEAVRLGGVTVYNLGSIQYDSIGFQCASHIYPVGFRSARIYWSTIRPMQRTVYLFEILHESSVASPPPFRRLEEYDPQPELRRSQVESDLVRVDYALRGEEPDVALRCTFPVFRVVAADQPDRPMLARTMDELFYAIRSGAMERNRAVWEKMKLRSELKSFGLNAAQFFGLGLEAVREAVEYLPDAVAAAIVPVPELQYRPSFYHVTNDDIYRTQRKQMSIKATVKINENGCARAQGWDSYSTVIPGSRIGRSLVKQTERKEEASAAKDTIDEAELAARANNITSYLEMRSVPFSQTLAVRRSPIHGWGLFALKDFPQGVMIVEYVGEVIRAAMGDAREQRYEDDGLGSCYLFRLDRDAIVDATRIGGMARFINHCCDPNADALHITLENGETRIVISARRTIRAGEEITYDYKFEYEEEKLECLCGAKNCRGFMN